MRRALAVLTCALVCAPAWAEWTKLGTNGIGDTYYVDLESHRITGSLRRVWTLTDYQYPSRGGVRSTKAYREFDCAAGQHRFLQSHFYLDQMGKGRETGAVEQPQAWREVPPESVLATLLEFVCNLS